MRTTRLIQHSAPTLGEEEAQAVNRVLLSGRIAQGPEVQAFEEECAAFVGRRHGIAVSSGTAALHLALNALATNGQTRVVIPSYACASLMTAIELHGGGTLLADIGPDFNLNIEAMPFAYDLAIIPHLFGAPARLPQAGLVIEDIAQSIGGPTGAASPVAIASFYATKLMTTGEGGMLLTDDRDIAEYARDHRDYDNRNDFVPRFAYKMTDLQAAIGRVQLRRLPGFIARRREIADRYLNALHDLPLGLPDPDDHVFFRFVVTTDRREALEAHLLDEGVEVKRPVYRPAHQYINAKGARGSADKGGSYPRSDHAHHCAVSLPIHPSLSDNDVLDVIGAVQQFFKQLALAV